MKKLIILSLVLMVNDLLYGQIRWSDYSQTYRKEITQKKDGIGVLAAIPMENNSYWVNHSNSFLMSKLGSDSSFMHDRPDEFIAINSFDSAAAHFFGYGIQPENSDEFEYRVLKNGITYLKDWSPILQYSADSVQLLSGMPKMAYLGAYKVDTGNYEVVDVRNKKSGRIVATAVVEWRKLQPVISDVYTSNDLNDFITRLSRPWKYDRQAMTVKKWQAKYKNTEIDSLTGLPKKLFLKHNENNLIFFLDADIYKSSQIIYQLSGNGAVIRKWGDNEFDNSIVWLNNLSPGTYRLEIKYRAQQENITTFDFEISKAWYQTTIFKIVTIILIAAFIGFVILSVILVKQRQLALKEETRKAILQMEIKTIHSQFNPHFVFNALNSIQGLINKEDIRGASKYLSVFGQLMRNSLANSDKNLVSLSEEINTLETYLQLEKLRFGFMYTLEVGPSINQYEVEIPSLLLQPLIENSIKHGVAALRAGGLIELRFQKDGSDLSISIKDNGPGFDPAKEVKGYGLKLTSERIKLMNKILVGQSIEMDVQTKIGSPTNVYLVFRNWFK